MAEVATTRRIELQLAYPGVVSVGHGLRTRRSHQATKTCGKAAVLGKVLLEPCVILMVARKWRPGVVPAHGRPIPPFLWSYIGTRKGRVLCAVPTDVRCAREFTVTPRAEDDNGYEGLQYVRVTDGDVHPPQKGTFCCAVRDPETDRLYGLSCHHVLAMSLVTYPPGEAAASEIALRSTQARIGDLDFTWIGGLTNEPGEWSFDAALCRVEAGAEHAFRSSCGAIRPVNWVASSNDYPLNCMVMTPSQGKLKAIVVGEFPDWSKMRYFSGGRQPEHRRILELDIVAGTTTKKGDSGCAILNLSGSTLIGMHIGGAENGRRIFAIPAYDLFDGVNWRRNTDLTLATDF